MSGRRNILWFHFPFAWLTIGFSGGAIVLLLLAVPLESYLSKHGWSRNLTNVLLSLLALCWIISSGILAWKICRTRTRTRHIWIFHGLLVLLCMMVFHAFIRTSAGLFAGFRGEETTVTERFTFGPIPDRAKMESLRREGYSGIVSLLSPLVPFEAVLLEREREDAAAAGMELIEASMLPWVTSNLDAIALIRKLAHRPTGRFYVHCYLGRHRAELARFVILEETQSNTAIKRWLPARFTRGPLVYFGDTFVIGPAPTREELFEFLVRSGVRRIIILGDSLIEPEWVSVEKSWAAAAAIEVRYVLWRNEKDAAPGDEILERQGELTYIHGFYVDAKTDRFMSHLDPLHTWKRLTPPREDVVANFISRIDTLPISMPFTIPAMLERGPVHFSKDGRWAAGPLPTGEEWRGIFAGSGVRFVISMLDPENEADRSWLAEEQGEVEQLGADLLVLRVERRDELASILRTVRLLPDHIYIHGYAKEERIDWLMEFLEGRDSAPRSLERGPVSNPAPGLFLGPLPTPDEWNSLLAPAGILAVVTLMDEHDAGNRIWFDQIRFAVHDLGFRHVIIPPGEDGRALKARIELLRRQGPVFVHAYRADDLRLQILKSLY